jgi:phage terminase small subunit
VTDKAIKLKPLTEKEEAFVEHLFSNGYDRKSAVLNAGYSTDRPMALSYDLIKRPHIQAAMAIEKERRRRMLFLDELDVIEGLHNEATNTDARPSERIQAWVHIGKHYGMFQPVVADQNKKDTGPSTVIINYNDENFKENQIKKDAQKAVEYITTEEEQEALENVEITSFA